MPDLALKLNEDFEFDLERGDSKHGLEDGLRTAVALSLFCDARADAAALPRGETDPRGYWAETFQGVEGDKFGSLLWSLHRAKHSADTLARAQEYAAAALKWLVDDGVASAVDVVAEWRGEEMLVLSVAITRPTGENVRYEYTHYWATEASR